MRPSSTGNISKTLQRGRARHGWNAALLCVGVLLPGCSSSSPSPHSPWPQVALNAQDRLLILAPHPDDEVLGCGGIIQRAVAMGLPVRVVFFTYGDNNQWSFLVYRKHPVLAPGAVRQMGALRHDEAMAADQLLGLSPAQLTFLGYPDFGTLHIWQSHWDDRLPFRSMLTHVTEVPYHDAFRPGAAYKGEEILRDLTTIVRDFRPTKVFVSHPGDHMPDHAALYLFTRIALWDLEPELHADVYPYLVHVRRWPRPRGFRPTADLIPPGSLTRSIAWQEDRLTLQELERKQAAIQAHKTQYGYSAKYLLSFVGPNELFGDFPIIKLHANAPPAIEPSATVQPGLDNQDELTDEEQARFVGLEERRVWLEDDTLALSITYSRPLAEATELSVFAFGWRSDRAFGRMPKLHLNANATSHHLLDQDQALSNPRIRVVRTPTRVTIHIPLDALGRPHRIFTSARTYFGEVPLDWASWRVLELEATPGASP